MDSSSSESDNFQKILKTQPDEVLEDEDIKPSQNIHSNKDKKAGKIISIPVINKKLIKSIKQEHELMTPEIKNNQVCKKNNN